MAEIEDKDEIDVEAVVAFAKDLGYRLSPWQLALVFNVLNGQDHEVIYSRAQQNPKSITYQLIQHFRNKDQLGYGAIIDEGRRWDTYCEEWGTPNWKAYLKQRWSDHLDHAANGDNVNVMWSSAFVEGSPVWELSRYTDLTSWGLGLSFDIDWRENRWDLQLEIGPSAISLARTGLRRRR